MHDMLLSRWSAGYACLGELETRPNELVLGKCNASDGGLAVFIRKAMDVPSEGHAQPASPPVSCRVGLIDDGTVFVFYPGGYTITRAGRLQVMQ